MENIEAMLCAYIEGDLDAAGRAQIEKHLQDHPQHRKLIQELSTMRELVRGLPRVKAPVEIGESLRGKVERSILLGDSGDTHEQTATASRWPQLFAIAAIFLLCASLCLVLYKALIPTMKPAVFTEGGAQKLLVAPPTDLTATLSVPTTQESQNGNLSDIDREIAPAASAAPVAMQRPPAVVQQQQAVAAAQFNAEDVRQRLLKSGYDISGANASPPVLMVVNSTDFAATNAQVAQFLNGSTGIKWKQVPVAVDDVTKSIATTLPSAGHAFGGAMSVSNADDKLELDRQAGAATTQPASEVYVAKGLTPERTDALRQSLAVQENNSGVQVFVESARVLATTQPTVVSIQKDAGVNHGGVAGSATTEPTETANTSVDLSTPTTAPSSAIESGDAASKVAADNRVSVSANGNSGSNSPAMLADNSQNLQAGDIVIVIQSKLAGASAPGSAAPVVPAVSPQSAADTPPATQPSPSTQP